MILHMYVRNISFEHLWSGRHCSEPQGHSVNKAEKNLGLPKDPNQHFIEIIQMASKYRKRCSTLLDTRKMQMKSAKSHTKHPPGWLRREKKKEKIWQECGTTETHECCQWEDQCTTTLENWQPLQSRPRSFTLSVYPAETHTYVH